MTRTLILTTLLALSLDHAHCQDFAHGFDHSPAFEVASITPCKPGTPEPPGQHAGMIQFTFPGGNFRASATTLTFLLEWAHGIQPSQHSEGPAWMDTDRYDIIAKAPGNATDAEMKEMLQTLLAERFHLQVHHEKKALPLYVVSAGKTLPKLYPAKDGETHSIQMTPQQGTDQKTPAYHVVATRFSVDQLLDALSRPLGRIVSNETGLRGEYDFTLDFAPDETRPNPLDSTLILTALREQLGLTVKAQTSPVDFLVIDSAQKVAAGN